MINGGSKPQITTKNPRISIITVVYNGESSIEKTIQSVINQKYDNIEYIIIDGNSSDNTLEIIRKYDSQISYWQSEEDNGLYDAMNKGIEIATGDWINFMNSGDVFYDNMVLDAMFTKVDLSSIDVLFGNSIEIDNNRENKLFCSADPKKLFLHPTYRHGASFIRRDIHKKIKFDLRRKDLGFALDYNQIHTMISNGYNFKKVEMFVIKYEKDGISNDIKKEALYNYYITRGKKPFYALFRYVIISIKNMFGMYR